MEGQQASERGMGGEVKGEESGMGESIQMVDVTVFDMYYCSARVNL